VFVNHNFKKMKVMKKNLLIVFESFCCGAQIWFPSAHNTDTCVRILSFCGGRNERTKKNRAQKKNLGTQNLTIIALETIAEFKNSTFEIKTQKKSEKFALRFYIEKWHRCRRKT